MSNLSNYPDGVSQRMHDEEFAEGTEPICDMCGHEGEHDKCEAERAVYKLSTSDREELAKVFRAAQEILCVSGSVLMRVGLVIPMWNSWMLQDAATDAVNAISGNMDCEPAWVAKALGEAKW